MINATSKARNIVKGEMLNLCKPGPGFTKFKDVPQVLSQNKHQDHCIVRKHNPKRYPIVA